MKNASSFFRLVISLVFTFAFLTISDVKADESSYSEYDLKEAVQYLKSKQVFFAHQSVGNNILSGVSRISDELVLTEIDDPSIPDTRPSFYHTMIGENTVPLSKLTEYDHMIREGIGEKVDLSMLKLCYIDFGTETDVEAVFAEYKRIYDGLIEDFPNVTFIHFTTPLTTVQTGLKARLKRLLGRSVYGDIENIKREQFNHLIRMNYNNIFDLAEIESTQSDGTRSKYKLNDIEYYGLVSAYTYDGGHLNEAASQMIAAEWLIFLSNMK